MNSFTTYSYKFSKPTVRVFSLALVLLSHMFLLSGQPDTCKCSQSAFVVKNFEKKVFASQFHNQFVGAQNQFLHYWQQGTIEFADGSKVCNENLRLNCYFNQLLWLRSTDYGIGVVNKEMVQGFHYFDTQSQRTFDFKKLKLDKWLSNDSNELYLQVLTEGTVSLYANRKSRRFNDKKEMELYTEYYLLKDGMYHKLKPNRYLLYKAMGTAKENMRSIIRGNHLRVKNEDQFVKAIQLYNQQY